MKIDYSVQLTMCPDGERFGWSIYQGENELGHSAGTFGTRIEALMDSARSAALLIFSEGGGASLLGAISGSGIV
jgi:hypothetical protein